MVAILSLRRLIILKQDIFIPMVVAVVELARRIAFNSMVVLAAAVAA